ncbi:hypothetical protein B5E62_15720 [Lachnoclostridium sp. An118]|nr:hypothetical protein B5E62_15720 [Lachnoclostridium sp. An118]
MIHDTVFHNDAPYIIQQTPEGCQELFSTKKAQKEPPAGLILHNPQAVLLIFHKQFAMSKFIIYSLNT